MAISRIAALRGTGTTISGGFAFISLSGLTLLQDDILVVGIVAGDATTDFNISAAGNNSIGVGTTEEADLYSNDTNDTNLYVGTILQGATVDTQVNANGFGGSGVTYAYHIIQYRGVDTTTPIDTTTQTTTAINGSRPDPPAITPVTADAKIVAFYGASQGTSSAWTAPANMSNFIQDANGKGRIGSGDADWTSGAFDPDAVTGGTTAVSDSYAAAALALRPASTAVTGDLSATLGSTTVSSAAALAVVAAASVTLGSLSLSSDALLDAKIADAAITLGSLSASADATLPIQADATPTLGALTASSDGTLPLVANSTPTLGVLSLSSATHLAPLTHVPSTAIRSISWSLGRPASINASGWTGARTVVAYPWHAKWKAHVEIAAVQGESDVRAWRAFIAAREGQINPFRIHATAGAQNANSGVTVSSTAAQGATSMAITGAATPLTDGQFVTVNHQLLCCTADQSGSTISFQPPLREAATAGTTVVTDQPYALVYMAQSQCGWSVGRSRVFNIAFDAEEAALEDDGQAAE